MKKIALLFPGQGSQYVGMGKSLYEKSTAAREAFEEASDVLGFDLKKLCFEGSAEELTRTENAQPAILTVSVAAFREYMLKAGIRPLYAAGHSLGEISALTCAGAVKLADALRIVRQRGRFMQEAVAAGEGAMAAIGEADLDMVEYECKRITGGGAFVVVSNYNSPSQMVVSGYKQAVEEVCTKLKSAGARTSMLKVSAPFHTMLLQSAAVKLKEELGKYEYDKLQWSVVSNVTALPYEDESRIIDTLTEQITHPVRWKESMDYLKGQGIELAIDMGPQSVVKNLMKSNAPDIQSFTCDKEDDNRAIMDILSSGAGAGMSGRKAANVLAKSMAIAVCTQNHNWDNDAYQIGVIQPYRKIKQMQEELEKEGREPTIEQMREAVEMLKSVFKTKNTPIEEQIQRFNQLFDQTGTQRFFSDFEFPKEY